MSPESGTLELDATNGRRGGSKPPVHSFGFPTNPPQQDKGPEGSWVHAHLHRKEGDQGIAAYWYGRAGGVHRA